MHATWTNPVEAKAHFETGALVPVVAATEKRIADYPDVPTLIEKGYDVTIVQHRIIVGAPGMSKEAIAFYSDLIKKIFDTPEFQEYLKSNSLTPSLVVGEDFAKLSDKVGETYTPLIKKIWPIRQRKKIV
jgi:tripartite-type tricarboxylate transporter receptor subunit TctC